MNLITATQPSPGGSSLPATAEGAGRSTFGRRMALAAAWLPALLPLVLITRYGVNVPHWDEWFFGDLIVRLHRHELTWDYLFRFHNEHRVLVPRLIFLAMTSVLGWNTKAEMYLSLLLALGTSILWACVAIRTYGRGASTIGLILLTNLVVFSAVPSENWLWGFQIQLTVSVLALAGGIWAVTRQGSWRIRLFLALVCAWIMTLSMASGVLAFIIFLPPLLDGVGSRRAAAVTLVLWLASAAGAYACYAHVPKLGGQATLTSALHTPIQAGLYYLSYLGGCLNVGWHNDPVKESALLGLIIVSLFGLSSLHAFWKRWCLGEPTRDLVWVMLGVYALGCAGLTTLGRLKLGTLQSLDARYALFSGCLVVATIFLVAGMLRDIAGRIGERGPAICGRIGAGFAGALVVLWALSAAASLPTYEDMLQKRLVARCALQFCQVAPDRPIMGRVLFYAPAWNPFYQDADILDRAGYFNPPLLRIKSMTEIAADPHGRPVGHFDTLVKQNDIAEGAYGWAVLPDRIAPADTVVLSYRNALGDEVPFCLMEDNRQPRPDIARLYGSNRVLNCGWQRSIAIGWVPKDCSQITAWAYDSSTEKAYRLDGTLTLQR